MENGKNEERIISFKSQKKRDAGVFVAYLGLSETCFAVIKQAGIARYDSLDKCVRMALL
jgi:hypothetical protein